MPRIKPRTTLYLVGLTELAALLGWAWHLWSRDPFEKWSYDLIHDPSPEIRNQAFNKIVLNRSRLDPDPARLLSLLIEAMRDPDPKVRIGAIVYVPYVGEISSAAIPDIIKVAKDPNASVRVAAIHSLGYWLRQPGRENDERILPVIRAATRDESSGVRLAAEKALSRLRPSEVAIPSRAP